MTASWATLLVVLLLCGCGCASRKTVKQSEFVGKHAPDFGAWLKVKSAEKEAEKIGKAEAEAAAKFTISHTGGALNAGNTATVTVDVAALGTAVFTALFISGLLPMTPSKPKCCSRSNRFWWITGPNGAAPAR